MIVDVCVIFVCASSNVYAGPVVVKFVRFDSWQYWIFL